MNYADNKAFDYPLIRRKYLLLIVIAPCVIAETVVQGAYFLNLSNHGAFDQGQLVAGHDHGFALRPQF